MVPTSSSEAAASASSDVVTWLPHLLNASALAGFWKRTIRRCIRTSCLKKGRRKHENSTVSAAARKSGHAKVQDFIIAAAETIIVNMDMSSENFCIHFAKKASETDC